jgi:hypothetical protein
MTETTSGNGANHLARDSKLGLAVTFLGGVALDAAIGALADVDTSTWSGWWVPFVALGVSTGLGALTAYKAKRRVAGPTRGYEAR